MLSLCACGSVDIGPLTFNFDVKPTTNIGNIWTDESAAVIAPPVEETAPTGDTISFEDFSLTPRGSFMSDLTPRGYYPDVSTENPALYIFFVFDYTEYAGNSDLHKLTYVSEVVIDGVGYPVLDLSAHQNHFINYIDRYFSYEYAAPADTLNAGESTTMIACFEIPEEARIAIHNGAQPIYCVRDTYVECVGYSDILFIEETFSVSDDPDLALSQAQLLWSLDMSYYLIHHIMLSTEVYGGSGTFEPVASEIMYKMFANGNAFSPASAPDLNGFFTIDYVGMQGMIPEFALEMYGGDAMDRFFEYRDICLKIADLAMTPDCTEDLYAHCEHAVNLYFELTAILGINIYEFTIDEV